MIKEDVERIAAELIEVFSRYQLRSSTKYAGRLIKLQLMYYNTEHKERSGLGLSIDPTLVEEHIRRQIEMGITALDKHIMEREAARAGRTRSTD